MSGDVGVILGFLWGSPQSAGWSGQQSWQVDLSFARHQLFVGYLIRLTCLLLVQRTFVEFLLHVPMCHLTYWGDDLDTLQVTTINPWSQKERETKVMKSLKLDSNWREFSFSFCFWFLFQGLTHLHQKGGACSWFSAGAGLFLLMLRDHPVTGIEPTPRVPHLSSLSYQSDPYF